MLTKKWYAEDYLITGFVLFVIMMMVLAIAAVSNVDSKRKACEAKGGHFFFTKYETICFRKELVIP